jgi:hypothetical protein
LSASSFIKDRGIRRLIYGEEEFCAPALAPPSAARAAAFAAFATAARLAVTAASAAASAAAAGVRAR